MFLDALEVAPDRSFDYDICVVGGGVAGLTIARDLMDKGLSICVLESGGKAFNGKTQNLYHGKAELVDAEGNRREFDDYLHKSRMRMLGGSANAWGGKCGPLDPSDFEQRSWMPNSGWPIDKEDLRPYYDRACKTLSVSPFDYDPNVATGQRSPSLDIGEGGAFATTVRHFSEVRRDGPPGAFAEFRDGLAEVQSVDVFLNANVVDIRTHKSREHVDTVVVATLAGNRFTVSSRLFVLATGGIENARLLLLSNNTWKKGLGNDNGLVGRFFAGHYSFSMGNLVFFSGLDQSIELYTGKDRARPWGVLSLLRAAQREHQLPNFTITMGPSDGEPATKEKVILGSVRAVDSLGHRQASTSAEQMASAYFMAEQQANPESRIQLDTSPGAVDALGQARTRLEWKFTHGDLDAFERGMALFARELGRESFGRLRAPTLETPGNGAPRLAQLSFSRHHLGATRMNADPSEGVANEDARVHGVDNLYIAGSSLFPTGGIANPTLTLVALAHRLSDHIESGLKR